MDKNHFRRFFRKLNLHLPFRMALGKFGIRIAAIGRWLQIRYANWNSEFRLVHEFHHNSDCCSLHVSEQVTRETVLSFDSPTSQERKMSTMVRALFGIKGVVEVTLMPYEISIQKGHVYSWQELLPEIERVIMEHLVGQKAA